MNMKRSFGLFEANEEFCDPWSIEYLYSIEENEKPFLNSISLPKKLAHVMHRWTWQKCESYTEEK